MRYVFSSLIAIVAIITLLSLTACTEKVYQDGQPVDDSKPSEIVRDTADSPVDTKLGANSEVTKLYARQGQVKSFSFDLAKLPDKRAFATYVVKDNLVRVTPPDELVREDPIHVVYLDMSTKDAQGYCLRGSNCAVNVARDMNYDEWIVPMPLSWATDAQYGKVVGTLMFYNKQVTRVQYQKGALYYEVYFDNYFGYPVRVAIASDPDFKTIVGGYEYRNIIYNQVSDADVVFTPK